METSSQFNLDLPSYERSNCSPKINRDFVGLLISAPKEIDFNEEKEFLFVGDFVCLTQ
jgi:hypothetical protein